MFTSATRVTHHGSAATQTKSSSSGGTRADLVRVLFLAAAILLSAVPYVAKLGFYSDDWSFLADLHNANVHSMAAGIRALLPDGQLRDRPGQLVLLVALYRLSGLHPIGYHLANAAIFVLGIVLFYSTLRLLELPLASALAIPLVYGFLPHYATDRFWLAAFQANLSMTLCFLAYYAGLKSLGSTNAWSLRLLSTGSLAASLLSYETTTGLLLALPAVLWWRVNVRNAAMGNERGPNRDRFKTFLLATAGVLLVLLFYKALARTHFISHPHSLQHATAAVKHLGWELLDFNFLQYGLLLPSVLHKVFALHPGITTLLLCAFLAAGLFLYLTRAALAGSASLPSSRFSLRLIVAGLAVWGLGYMIYVPMYAIDFTTTGVANRLCNACAVGTAFVIVGFIGLASRIPRGIGLQRTVLCLGITAVCVSGFLVIHTLASFWIHAYRQQQEIISDIRTHVPRLPANSTLFLAGTCSYLGPGIVFETGGDLEGALSILYGDPTLRANVTRKLQVAEQGIDTELYGAITNYPFSPRMYVYDYRDKTFAAIPDASSARRYFQSLVPAPGCKGEEGVGAPVF